MSASPAQLLYQDAESPSQRDVTGSNDVVLIR
jgi:hypothetical protein